MILQTTLTKLRELYQDYLFARFMAKGGLGTAILTPVAELALEQLLDTPLISIAQAAEEPTTCEGLETTYKPKLHRSLEDITGWDMGHLIWGGWVDRFVPENANEEDYYSNFIRIKGVLQQCGSLDCRNEVCQDAEEALFRNISVPEDKVESDNRMVVDYVQSESRRMLKEKGRMMDYTGQLDQIVMAVERTRQHIQEDIIAKLQQDYAAEESLGRRRELREKAIEEIRIQQQYMATLQAQAQMVLLEALGLHTQGEEMLVVDEKFIEEKRTARETLDKVISLSNSLGNQDWIRAYRDFRSWLEDYKATFNGLLEVLSKYLSYGETQVGLATRNLIRVWYTDQTGEHSVLVPAEFREEWERLTITKEYLDRIARQAYDVEFQTMHLPRTTRREEPKPEPRQGVVETPTSRLEPRVTVPAREVERRPEEETRRERLEERLAVSAGSSDSLCQGTDCFPVRIEVMESVVSNKEIFELRINDESYGRTEPGKSRAWIASLEKGKVYHLELHCVESSGDVGTYGNIILAGLEVIDGPTLSGGRIREGTSAGWRVTPSMGTTCLPRAVAIGDLEETRRYFGFSGSDVTYVKYGPLKEEPSIQVLYYFTPNPTALLKKVESKLKADFPGFGSVMSVVTNARDLYQTYASPGCLFELITNKREGFLIVNSIRSE